MLSFIGSSRGVSVNLQAQEWSYTARIMPVGDSITSGTLSPKGDGYRGPLWQKFSNAGVAIDFVGQRRDGPASFLDPEHQGTPGQRADELAQVIPNLMNKYKPDLVLLMIGTNDIEQEGSAGASRLKSEISSILDDIAARLPNSTVVVSTLPPIAAGVSGSNLVPRANAAIREAAADAVAEGHRVSLMTPQLTRKDIADSDHPTSRGYAKLADDWFNAIMAVTPPVGGTPGGYAMPVAMGENQVTGSRANDRILGNDQANTLRGDAGNDLLFGLLGDDALFGGKGNDRIDGGAGSDRLHGGAGRDVLRGGTGPDTFSFSAASDSMPASRDVIYDFVRGDRVDLSAIDANSAAAGNQRFTLVADFTGAAGQLQWTKTRSGFIVDGDVNGDGAADFSLQLNASVASLHRIDFVL